MWLLAMAPAASDAAEHAASESGAAHSLFGAEFWVAVFFFVLMGVFAWLGVFKWLGQTLDKRAARIRGELDEARSLKEEAQAALAQLQRRQREAAREAGEILEHAREEAALMQREMAANVEALIERRTQLAEDRIAQAEVAAAKHVRATAVDVATRAAARAIAAHLPASKHGELTDIAIDELDRKLH